MVLLCFFYKRGLSGSWYRNTRIRTSVIAHPGTRRIEQFGRRWVSSIEHWRQDRHRAQWTRVLAPPLLEDADPCRSCSVVSCSRSRAGSIPAIRSISTRGGVRPQQAARAVIQVDLLFPRGYTVALQYELRSTDHFDRWLNKVRDKTTRARIFHRLDAMAMVCSATTRRSPRICSS